MHPLASMHLKLLPASGAGWVGCTCAVRGACSRPRQRDGDGKSSQRQKPLPFFATAAEALPSPPFARGSSRDAEGRGQRGRVRAGRRNYSSQGRAEPVTS